MNFRAAFIAVVEIIIERATPVPPTESTLKTVRLDLIKYYNLLMQYQVIPDPSFPNAQIKTDEVETQHFLEFYYAFILNEMSDERLKRATLFEKFLLIFVPLLKFKDAENPDFQLLFVNALYIASCYECDKPYNPATFRALYNSTHAFAQQYTSRDFLIIHCEVVTFFLAHVGDSIKFLPENPIQDQSTVTFNLLQFSKKPREIKKNKSSLTEPLLTKDPDQSKEISSGIFDKFFRCFY